MRKYQLPFSNLAAVCSLIAVGCLTFAGQSVVAQEADDRAEVQLNELKVEVRDGTVVITGPSGEQRTVELDDIEGANAIVVQTQAQDDNGEIEVRGRAVLVGPEGKQSVVLDDIGELEQMSRLVLLGGEGESAVEFADLPELLFSANENRFFIGVDCSAISDLIKSQMDLDSGLAVVEVFEESPASSAGVETHDILLSIDGTKLNEVGQLVEAVQGAGENESSLQIKCLRSGDVIEIEVSPQKRSESTFHWSPGNVEADTVMMGSLSFDQPEFRFQQMMPGVIQAQSMGNLGELEEAIRELQESVEQLREEIRNK